MAVTSRPMGFISSSLPTRAMVCPTSFKLPTKPPLSKEMTPPTLPLISVHGGTHDAIGRDIGIGGRGGTFEPIHHRGELGRGGCL